jgi:hypothetical protein
MQYNIDHDSYGRIGSQVISIKCDGERLIAETEINIEVEYLFWTLYERAHRIREEWREDRLLSFRSDLVEDGEHQTVDADVAGDTMVIDTESDRFEAPADVISSNPWPLDLVHRDLLFSIKTGEILNVRTRAAGTEDLKISAQQGTAQKFVVSGDLDAELWYDDLGWLRARLPNDRDDSKITITRK